MKVEFLEGQTPTGLRWRFPLRVTPIRIGRSPAADLQVFDELCSEIHVILSRQTNNWTIQAQDQHRPVFLSGQVIEQGIFTRGAVLMIGATEMRLGVSGDKSAATSLDLGVRPVHGIEAIIETSTGQRVSSFLIGSQPIVIGRSSDADILVEGDSAVSGRHVAVTAHGDEILVEDLGSTNGTYVAGKPIASPQLLHMSEHVEIGRLQIRFDRTLRR